MPTSARSLRRVVGSRLKAEDQRVSGASPACRAAEPPARPRPQQRLTRARRPAKRAMTGGRAPACAEGRRRAHDRPVRTQREPRLGQVTGDVHRRPKGGTSSTGSRPSSRQFVTKERRGLQRSSGGRQREARIAERAVDSRGRPPAAPPPAPRRSRADPCARCPRRPRLRFAASTSSDAAPGRWPEGKSSRRASPSLKGARNSAGNDRRRSRSPARPSRARVAAVASTCAAAPAAAESAARPAPRRPARAQRKPRSLAEPEPTQHRLVCR
jgi:hypothetical protein